MNIDMDELHVWTFATYGSFLSSLRAITAPTHGNSYGFSITHGLQNANRHAVFIQMMAFLLEDDGHIHLRKQAIKNVFDDVASAAQACQNFWQSQGSDCAHNRGFRDQEAIVQNFSFEFDKAKNVWSRELEHMQKSIEDLHQQYPSAPRPFR